MKTPVILDLALRREVYLPLLVLASDPAFDIRAITLSGAPREAEVEELKALLSRLGVRAPVACGSGPSAVELMGEALRAEGPPLSIIVWGPLSNVAPLLLAQPELKGRIRAVSFAGGSFRGGNATVAAEGNVYADPEALDILLRSGVRTYMAPLELNGAATVSQLGGALSQLRQRVEGPEADGGEELRDLLAALVTAYPQHFQTRELYVETELNGEFSRGATVADFKGQLEREPNVSVLEAVHAEKLSPILSELSGPHEQEVTP